MPRETVIPPNFFGMAFGIAGLGVTWLTAAHYGEVSGRVGDTLLIVSGAVWAVTAGVYVFGAASVGSRVRSDLHDPVTAPFLSLSLITPIILAASGVAPHDAAFGRGLVNVFLVLTLIAGAWVHRAVDER